MQCTIYIYLYIQSYIHSITSFVSTIGIICFSLCVGYVLNENLFQRCKMTWTKQHDIMLCREILLVQPFRFKHGTRDRGRCWEKIAQNLNYVERPHFLVDMRGVRDRFTKLEKNFRKKRQVKRELVAFALMSQMSWTRPLKK